MELITVTFTQWAKWNPRKDIKHPTWFAMSNRITEDDDIQTLSDAEFRAFVHIFCLASQKNGPTVLLNLEKAERVTGIKRAVFLKSITKLCAFGTCTRSVGNPSDADRETSATLQDITLQDTTLPNTTPQPADADDGGDVNLDPIGLAQLWNEKASVTKSLSSLRNNLPLVDVDSFESKSPRWKLALARLKSKPKRSYWISVIDKILSSSGCCGRNESGWLADFEFLVRNETHTKALEGKYDSWGKLGSKKAPPAGGFQRDTNPTEEFAALMSEGVSNVI